MGCQDNGVSPMGRVLGKPSCKDGSCDGIGLLLYKESVCKESMGCLLII